MYIMCTDIIYPTRVTAIANNATSIHPVIGPILLVWGSCWGRYTTTILPNKDDEITTNQPTKTIPSTIGPILPVWGSGDSVVLLLYYLTKMTRNTTNQPTKQNYTTYYRTNITCLRLCGESCTITILPHKDDEDYNQPTNQNYTIYNRTNITCLRLWG